MQYTSLVLKRCWCWCWSGSWSVQVEFTRRFVLSVFLASMSLALLAFVRTSSRLSHACQCTPQVLLIKPQLAEHPLVEAFRNAVSPGYFAMEENEKSSSG